MVLEIDAEILEICACGVCGFLTPGKENWTVSWIAKSMRLAKTTSITTDLGAGGANCSAHVAWPVPVPVLGWMYVIGTAVILQSNTSPMIVIRNLPLWGMLMTGLIVTVIVTPSDPVP